MSRHGLYSCVFGAAYEKGPRPFWRVHIGSLLALIHVLASIVYVDRDKAVGDQLFSFLLGFVLLPLVSLSLVGGLGRLG